MLLKILQSPNDTAVFTHSTGVFTDECSQGGSKQYFVDGSRPLSVTGHFLLCRILRRLRVPEAAIVVRGRMRGVCALSGKNRFIKLLLIEYHI